MSASPVTASARRHNGRLATALREPRAWVGMTLTLPIVLIAIVGPFLTSHDPGEFVGAPFEAGVGLFGTDALGRDVLSRFLAGGGTLLALSAAATLVGVLIGSLLGSLAGYVGGTVDTLIVRLADVVLAFPSVVLALMVLSLGGAQAPLIIAVVALGHVPRTLRVVRGATMSVVARDFIRYGDALGTSRMAMVVRDILPNVTGSLMVEIGLRFTYSIGLIAMLSFLGVGVQPPSPDWGNMINENRIALAFQPWGVILPLLAIAVVVIGTNLITDAIARAYAALGERTGA